jgi:outer membrane receptor for Fe3+-dicitrate
MHEYIRRLDAAVESGFISPAAANRSIAIHTQDCNIRSQKECNCKPKYFCILRKKKVTSIMTFRIEDDNSVLEL